jgi:polysaccharide deacetylase family protein (PEP-CTERM system associated)
MSPGGIQNAMTVDVEDWFHVQALSSSIDRSSWDQREYRAVANTRKLLELFAKHGVRATFFILGWVAERSPELVREIAAAGHEIACHGLSHQLVYTQTPEKFREETLHSKTLIENVTGTRLRGYRAASYSITGKSLWALDILLDAGFEYDSSIFPVRHDVYGIPDAPTAPGRYRAPSGREIVEFPLTTASYFGQRIPVCGGGYFRLLPYWLIRHGLSKVNRLEKTPFVFYLHPWEVDPGQPRVRASLLSRVRHYTNLDRVESRLNRLLGQFRFGTMAEVLAGQRLLPAS